MGISVVVGIVFNTFVNPIALENIGWKYYIVFLVIIVLYGITAYLTYPETRGHTLEQIAHIFDGDSAGAPPPEVIAEETAERSRSVAGSEKVALQHLEKA